MCYLNGSVIGPLHDDSLSSLSSRKVCMLEFLDRFEWSPALVLQFRRMAMHHRLWLQRRSQNRDARRTGAFVRHIRHNNAFRAVLQRVANRIKFQGVAPLEACPVQLGHSDATEWKLTNDCCGTCGSSWGVMRQACSAGRIGFKTHKHFVFDGSRLGVGIPEEMQRSVVVHNLKLWVWQSMFSGAIHSQMCGSLCPLLGFDSCSHKAGCYFCPLRRQGVQKRGSLRKHAGLLMEVARLRQLADDEACGDLIAGTATASSVNDIGTLLERVPLNVLVSCGELHIFGAWSNGTDGDLHLPFGSELSGPVLLLAGEYCGPQMSAMETVLHYRHEPATQAVRMLLGYHYPVKPMEAPGSPSMLASISLADVLAVVGSDLTRDQATVVQNIAEQPAVQSVAGSGKTTVAAGVVCAVCLELLQRKSKAKVVGTFPARRMRDDAGAVGRKMLPNPFLFMMFGRPVDEDPADDDDLLLDAMSAEYLQKAVRDHLVRVTDVKAEHAALLADIGESNSTWEANVDRRKALATKLVVATFTLEKAQAYHLRKQFSEATIIYMTVDCYNQIQSGNSIWSSLFAGCDIALAYVDECHQLRPEQIYSVAITANEMILFYDRPQEIEDTVKTRPSSNDSDELDDDHVAIFPWERKAVLQEGEKEMVWDWVPAARVARLTTTLRFDGKPCRLLRLTSQKYGDPKAGQIFAADEVDDPDPAALRLMPTTRMQVTFYHGATFHSVRADGSITQDARELPPRLQKIAAPHALPVGACPMIFAAMLHEGLVLLSLLEAGAITGPGSDGFPIVTMFYRNAVRDRFDAAVYATLTDTQILVDYALDKKLVVSKTWKVGTPTAMSGSDAVLAQHTILPRIDEYQDMHGHMESDGMRNVGLTRARRFSTMHVSFECARALGHNIFISTFACAEKSYFPDEISNSGRCSLSLAWQRTLRSSFRRRVRGWNCGST